MNVEGIIEAIFCQQQLSPSINFSHKHIGLVTKMRLGGIFCSLIVLIGHVHGEVLSDYHCGIGPITKVLSYAASTPCGRQKRE